MELNWKLSASCAADAWCRAKPQGQSESFESSLNCIQLYAISSTLWRLIEVEVRVPTVQLSLKTDTFIHADKFTTNGEKIDLRSDHWTSLTRSADKKAYRAFAISWNSLKVEQLTYLSATRDLISKVAQFHGCLSKLRSYRSCMHVFQRSKSKQSRIFSPREFSANVEVTRPQSAAIVNRNLYRTLFFFIQLHTLPSTMNSHCRVLRTRAFQSNEAKLWKFSFIFLQFPLSRPLRGTLTW